MKSAIKTTEAGSLRVALHQHLRRMDYPRDARNFHASDITREDPEYCPREAAIRVLQKVDIPPTKVTTSMAVTWDWGRLVEARVRDWFADMGMTVGDWECRHEPCKRRFKWQKRPKLCHGCGGRSFEYLERRVISAVSGISCGVDLLLDYGEARLRAVEIKSIDKEKFADLKLAKSEHRARTQVYLRCMAESEDKIWGRVNQQRARVLYVTKGGYGTKDAEMSNWDFADGGFSPFKEFVIERDDAAVEHLIQKAMAAREGMRGGELPDRLPECKSGMASKRASACPVNGRCHKLTKSA